MLKRRAVAKAKLRVKIGEAELSVEGPADLVKAEFEAFIALAERAFGGSPPAPTEKGAAEPPL